jgi:lipopolysaccharide/colanic/teichoic acid biosynthesis glycosyltransferase
VIKLTSRGPVFYGQERIGLSGEPFTMLKFRSMVTDADAHLADLLTAQGTGATPLFKVKDDPRITPAGRVLRRYSIDELPQLFNVLKGDMSLVGPRPQRDGEVRLYDSKAGRRLVVKPGMSGLWQVSGRSNLSWEASIRLDLFYVENWSITNDIIILLRTARAVFGANGAY